MPLLESNVKVIYVIFSQSQQRSEGMGWSCRDWSEVERHTYSPYWCRRGGVGGRLDLPITFINATSESEFSNFSIVQKNFFLILWVQLKAFLYLTFCRAWKKSQLQNNNFFF